MEYETNGEKIVAEHYGRVNEELKAQIAAKDEEIKAIKKAGERESQKQRILHRLEIEQGDDLTPLALKFLAESAQIDDEGHLTYQNHKAKNASELADKLKSDDGIAPAFFRSMSPAEIERKYQEKLKSQGLPDMRPMSPEDKVSFAKKFLGVP